MKYKLLKSLPDIEAGTIIEYKDDKYYFESGSEVHAEFNSIFYRIFHRDSKDWYEKLKEPNTIYDLGYDEEYWYLDTANTVHKTSTNYPEKNGWKGYEHNHCFLTEREAKRNKLLRDLATRNKWLPDKLEHYIDIYGSYLNWHINCIIKYHQGFIFRNEEEYNKWITEEAKDLLFNI